MSSLSQRPLLLISLNEVNFDLVESYLRSDPHRFPSLKKLLALKSIRTTSENAYNLLEPWIQWASVYTGLGFEEHAIYRLGDIVGSTTPQIFELLEQQGLTVGAIAPMNAENRLKRPAYFIPDPWTKTRSDPSVWSKLLSAVISQGVNDNAVGRLTGFSVAVLCVATLRFLRFKSYPKFLGLVAKSLKKPWRRALALDLLLHEVHLGLLGLHNPDFSTVFLNAGAHVQHHYFFNALSIGGVVTNRNPLWYLSGDDDPIIEMLDLYDYIMRDYLGGADRELVVATGLTQKPYDRLKFYYRLQNHAGFLRLIGINFIEVHPRMTRDFVVEFGGELECADAERLLRSLYVEIDGLPLFGEMDNRGSTLFITLTYPNEITDASTFKFGGKTHALAPNVAFVAIKNGMHDSEGFAFFSSGVSKFAPPNLSHVKYLGKTLSDYFGISAAPK